MTKIRLFALVLASASFSVAVAAQAPPNASPMPANPYARPLEMDANDKAIDSALEQQRRALRDNERDTAAKHARGSQATLTAKPAAPGDVVVAALVTDKFGNEIGRIASLESDGAVVKTGLGSVKVPLEAFGKSRKGLLLDMDKAQFDALVSQANAKPAG